MQYVFINQLRRLLEPPQKLLGPHVGTGMTVLDPGCGFGYFSLPLARLVGPNGRVLCVDIEPRAIAKLKKRASRAGLAERIDARVCAPRDLGLEDCTGMVDFAAIMHTMHEFEDLAGFLAQVTKLLKPTGRMLVVEPPGPHVSAATFAAEREHCRRAGFHALDCSRVALHRKVALFAVSSWQANPR